MKKMTKNTSKNKTPKNNTAKANLKTNPKSNLSYGLAQVLTPFINYQTIARFDQLAECDGVIYYFGFSQQKNKKKNLEAIVETHALDFQENEIKSSDKNTIHFIGKNGAVWIVFETINDTGYAYARDQFGSLVSQIKNLKLKNVSVYFQGVDEVTTTGSVVGLELASYDFVKIFKNSINTQSDSKPTEKLNIQIQMKKDQIEKALLQAATVQIARHLVNLPPNLINPAEVEKISKQISFSKNTTVEVWDEKKCEAEGMNLLLATGSGSPSAPRMIRFKYRPTTNNAAKNKKTKKPIAFVGKGITFDTGGLDIKPSSAMRLMKKDMGGAASVIALAYWADQSKYSRACDFYLALAENSVDGFSMRPSDIYQSRAGHIVEIDNTDAEGRLVLADVMDVAATQTGSDEPEYLIDIATLTGAIKVALGTEVAGFFTNDPKLASTIHEAGNNTGERNWQMPLVRKYFSSMSSNFADFKNSGESFGGAITAALFLEKFTAGKKWAHLDVYCWNDKSTGALASGQASGQPVQSMIEWLGMMV